MKLSDRRYFTFLRDKMIEGILIFLIDAIAPAVIEGILSTALHAISTLVPEIREAANDFREIHHNLNEMLGYLEEVENMTDDSQMIKNWVVQVRKAARSLEDLADEFMSLAESRARGGVGGHAHNIYHGGPDLWRARRIAKEIRTLKAKIKKIFNKRERFTSPRSEQASASSNGTLFPQVLASLDNGENLPGVIRNKKTVVGWLTEDEKRLMVVSVQGMGGLGKTTLARAVFIDAEVVKGFKYRAWLTVSQSWNADELLRTLAEQLKGGALRGLERGLSRICESSSQTVARNISHLLSNEKYLIVLDDVWNVSDARELLKLFPNNNRGSRILVTSRNGREACSPVTGGHVLKDLELEPLPDEEARYLFCKAAFGSADGCPQELKYSANKIIKTCNGLPLAIVAIGRAMAYKPRTQLRWNTTYQCLEWELRNNNVLRDMTKVLMLSYYDLPNHLKRCFLYCSLFPEDYTIKTKRLTRLWIAEGLIVEENGLTMEQAAEQYIEHLTSRSVLQVVARDEYGQPKACRMHDLMRKLAQQASSHELAVVDQGHNQPPNLINGNCRHLSIASHIEREAIARNSSILPQLRTLLVFSQDPSFVSSLPEIVSGLKFIRVLDLRGTKISELPDQVFDLFNLRYLSLRDTDVGRLSRKLKKLHFLQTLDLWNTKIKHLPREVLKLRHLRHLYREDINDSELKYHNVGGILRGKDVASRIWHLSSLQTLRTVKANEELVAELGNLKQLRSLGVTDLEAKDGNALCNSIHMLENLLRLSVKSCSKTEVLRLENLSPPPQYLRKLILNGRLERVPLWFESLFQLTQLHLFGTALEESQNPIPALQGLPNLVHLTLDEAYHSRYLLFEADGFARLEVLYLKHLKGLTQLRVEKRALPKLKKMYLLCLKMLRLVEGIQHLPELQDLYLKQMPSFDRNHVGPGVSVKQI